MKRNFWIPLVLFSGVIIVAVLSGNCSVASAIRLVLVIFAVLCVGKKTKYNFTYMWLTGAITFAVCFGLEVGLMKLEKYIPWIRTVLLWPTT